MSLPNETLGRKQKTCLCNCSLSLPDKTSFFGEAEQLVQVTAWWIYLIRSAYTFTIYLWDSDEIDPLMHHPHKVSVYGDGVNSQPLLSPKVSLYVDGVDLPAIISTSFLIQFTKTHLYW